jgi:hypothetical protein
MRVRTPAKLWANKRVESNSGEGWTRTLGGLSISVWSDSGGQDHSDQFNALRKLTGFGTLYSY